MPFYESGNRIDTEIKIPNNKLSVPITEKLTTGRFKNLISNDLRQMARQIIFILFSNGAAQDQSLGRE